LLCGTATGGLSARFQCEQSGLKFLYSRLKTTLLRKLRLEIFKISAVREDKAMERGSRGRGENIPSWHCSVAGPIGRLAENLGGLAGAAGRKLAVTLAPTRVTLGTRGSTGLTLILRALQRSQARPALRAFLRGRSSSASTGSDFVGVLSEMAAGQGPGAVAMAIVVVTVGTECGESTGSWGATYDMRPCQSRGLWSRRLQGVTRMEVGTCLLC
jgi:hypothetical protein